jgi:endo-1,4-beta-D-glucanase Y
MESSITLTPLRSNYTGKRPTDTGLKLAAAGTPKPDDLPRDEIDQMLEDSWKHYKKTMIAGDGRPLSDPDDGDIDGDGDRQERTTVSEAVSYVLLRAVWMNDKEAFAKTWHWAKFHLQRKNLSADDVYSWNKGKWIEPRHKDSLFAWRYIPTLKDKPGGVIDYQWMNEKVWRGSFEAATDADIDIAAALVFAGSRWNKPYCLAEARNILGDIWDKEVGQVGGQYYLFGGDQFKRTHEINPSYLRPSYLAMFAEVDPGHPWKELAATSYKAIIEGGHATLQGIKNKTNLPPNWLGVRVDGSFAGSQTFAEQGGYIFGWDSIRTLFWMAQDYAWSASPEARKYLTDNTCTDKDAGPYCFLKRELKEHGRLNGGYLRDGRAVPAEGWWSNNLNQEQFAMDGIYLAFFHSAGDRTAAKQIYDRLRSSYHEEGYWGDDPSNYYGQNLAWFGLALVSGLATNLYKPGAVIIPPQPAQIAPQPKQLAPPTPASIPAPHPPAAKLTPLKIQGTPLRFSKEEVTLDSGVYHFYCGPVTKDPGFAILTGGVNLAGRNSLKFEVKGSYKLLGGWANFSAEVYDEGAKKSNISSISKFHIDLSKDWNDVTFDLEELVSKAWKVQFMLATDKSECQDIQIKNLRFE